MVIDLTCTITYFTLDCLKYALKIMQAGFNAVRNYSQESLGVDRALSDALPYVSDCSYF